MPEVVRGSGIAGPGLEFLSVPHYTPWLLVP